jgi:hypothetical protein
VFAVPRQDLVDGVEGQLQAMLPQELDAQAFDAEPALAAQGEDQRLLGCEHLAVRRVVWPPAAVPQADLTFHLVAAPPLTQGRARDPAAPAHDAGIAHLFKELDRDGQFFRAHAMG